VRRALLPALLILGVVAAYANAVGASFQFDDWNVVVGDARVQSLTAWWHSMPGIRPLLKLSYAADHAAGLGAAGFHATNVAIHLANTVLLFVLFRWMAGGRDGMALAGTAVFALHPVQTEAVTYVSGRSASLAATFVLASAVLWVLGRERGATWWVRAASPACFACAVAVKETAVVTPVALLLLAAMERGARVDRRGLARDLARHAAVLALAVAALASSPTYRHLLATSLETRSVAESLRAQTVAVPYLAGQMVRWDRLNADPALTVPTAWRPGMAVAALTIAAGIAGALALLRRRAAWAFGVLWLFLWLAPTHSVLARLDLANDRHLYLALAGPAWLLALVLHRLPVRPRVVATTLLALVLIVGTHGRNRTYADEVVYWEDVAAKSPRNGRAWNNLGYAYALSGRREEAEAAYRRALDLDPDDYKAAINLGILRDHGSAAER
jgi:tetratricopeptide (TPR) repeat protein